jgi:hypothetical protein
MINQQLINGWKLLIKWVILGISERGIIIPHPPTNKQQTTGIIPTQRIPTQQPTTNN